MKVYNQFINRNTYYGNNTPKHNTTKNQPTFEGSRLNNRLLKEIYLAQNALYNKGVMTIQNVHSGEFGTICNGSKPLKSFWSIIPKDKRALIQQCGLSTNSQGIPRSFLKSCADKPLSTSFVHSCSVMYLYNKPTNTHFLYHASEQVPPEELGYMVKNFMPEGCTHAIIAPGDAYWSDIHKLTIPNMFNEIRKNAPKAHISVCHNSSKYPEIVGYQGRLYEITNKIVSHQKRLFTQDYGQASFKVSDIQGYNTIDVIKYDAIDKNSLDMVKSEFQSTNWDFEMKATLFDILEKRQFQLDKIEKCETLEELIQLQKEIDSENNLFPAFYAKEKLLIQKT